MAKIDFKLQHARKILMKLNSCVGYNEDDSELVCDMKNKKTGKYWTRNSTRIQKSKVTTSSSNNYVYVQTADNQFLKLVCPECEQSEFSHKSGFLNHCRGSHKIKFSTHEDAAKKCGILVDEREVPLDDPSRKQQLSFFYKKRKSNNVIQPPPKKIKETKNNSDDNNCIVKRIVIGNTCKLIQSKSEEKSTYKWQLYIRGTDDQDDISTFVKKVRFFLHDSYKPNHIIDVDSPPFSITRQSRFEFPVRVQLHFVDPRNHPVFITHQFQLSKNVSDLRETPIDIELDRRSFDKK